MTTDNIDTKSFLVLQLTFMFGSVLALILLPMVNQAIHLNNLIHTTVDEQEKTVLHSRLEKLRTALFFILIAILMVIWLLPLQYIYPRTIFTLPIFITASVLLSVSLIIFVMDASRSIYIPKTSLFHSSSSQNLLSSQI